MKIVGLINYENYIEIEITNGMNRYIHLLNMEYKDSIDILDITFTKYKKIVENCILEGLYHKCVKKILHRKKSINYIEEYLNKQLPNDRYCRYIVNRLIEVKYLDDNVYAKSYIKDMIHLSRYGPNRIVNNLKKEKISLDIIEKEIIVYSKKQMNENICYYINRYLKNNKDSYLMFKDKSINKLINKGYNIDDVLDYFRCNDIVIYEELLIKNYVSNSNVDLIKLKERLIKRGFNVDKVVSIIEENEKKKTLL